MNRHPGLSPDRSVAILGACLGIGAVLALLTFLFFGLSVWSALLAALLLACPAIIAWGLLIALRRRPRTPTSV